LKENAETTDIPVIALTASLAAGNSCEMDALFDGYLSKPVSVNDLISTLKKYIHCSTVQGVTIDSADTVEFSEIFEPAELMGLLNDEILASCKVLKDAMIMSRIKAFGETLVGVSAQHNIKILQQYGGRLLSLADGFDTVRIEQELDDAVLDTIHLLNSIWSYFSESS